MPRNSDINSAPSPRIDTLRGRLALVAAALALAPAAAVAQPARSGSPQSAASALAASVTAPTTVVKETVVKPSNDDPALPIVLSATALAVALAAGAHTLVRRTAGPRPRVTTHSRQATNQEQRP
jgi:hypothetical protein